MIREAVSIRITGRVQGVWFRASAKRKAEELHITGFARNEPNGPVYIEAEGEEANLRHFIEWCHHGPEHAQVDSVDVQSSVATSYKSFEIRH